MAAQRGVQILGPDLLAAVTSGGIAGLLLSSEELKKAIPRIPVIGRIGFAALAARFLSQHVGAGGAVMRDVSNALAVLAAYQMATKSGDLGQRIDGDDETIVLPE